jgi:hypothetical protein
MCGSYCYMCVLKLLYVCPDTIMCPHTTMCPHTAMYVSSYYMCPHTTIRVLILLYMCPLTPVCVLTPPYIHYCICRRRCGAGPPYRLLRSSHHRHTAPQSHPHWQDDRRRGHLQWRGWRLSDCHRAHFIIFLDFFKDVFRFF